MMNPEEASTGTLYIKDTRLLEIIQVEFVHNRTNFNKKIAETVFNEYGSWRHNAKVPLRQRMQINKTVESLLQKPRELLSHDDITKMHLYSGFGGLSVSNERGVLYDFYTSPPLAKMTWQLLNKVKPIGPHSSILEPSCGTGVFFDVAPKDVTMCGVELDNRSASVASILHPHAVIHANSFEQFNLSNTQSFDAVIGNVPFGDRSVSTSFMDMEDEKSLDKYFIRRSIDILKEDGICALIVHPGVLQNSSNTNWRMEISKMAQFAGALKLSDTSFQHTNTQVQPDILFFRKYNSEVHNRLAQCNEQDLITLGFYDKQYF